MLAVAVVFQVSYALSNSAPPIWDEMGHTRAANALRSIQSLNDVPDAIRASLRYGLVYPLWLASVYSAAGENFVLARVLQGLVSVATLALLYLTARELYGRRAGIVTLAAGVLYLPFVATAARLLSETLAVFWLALALWLIARGLTRDSARTLFLAGSVAVLTAMTRPTLQMMFVALGVGVFAALRLRRQKLQRGWFFVAGAALIILPVLLFTRVAIGRATLSGSVSPFEGIFVGNYIPDGGYPTDARSFERVYPQPEFDSLRAENRNPKDIDFARVTLEGAARDPLGFILLQARKFYDQWRAPFNDFEIGFGLPYSFQEVFHPLIILLGAVGALAFWKRQPVTVVLLLGWLYVIFTNLIVPVERRYAFPGVPVALILAGATVDEFISVAARRARWDATFRIASAIVLGAAFVLYIIFTFSGGAQNAREVVIAPGEKAEVTFLLPADTATYRQASFYIDAQALDPGQVRVRGIQPVELQLRENRIFENATYATLLERQGRTPNDISQWYRFDFDPRAVPDSELTLTIDGPARLAEDDAAVQAVLGPVLPALDSLEPNSNTSLYKYLADRDFRIPRLYMVESRYERPGQQVKPRTSFYRIVLVLTRDDGAQRIRW